MEPVKDVDGRAIKLFAVGDCEWWMGETAEAVQAAVAEMYGPLDDPDEMRVDELDDGAAERLIFCDSDDPADTTAGKRPFIEELRNECKQPIASARIFAATEY